MITYLQLHPNMRLVVAFALLFGLVAVIAVAWHRLVARRPDWGDDLEWQTDPEDLPGQATNGKLARESGPYSLAGEHHPDPDEWDHLDADQAAQVLIAEWHDQPAPYWMQDGPGTFHHHEPEGCPVCAIDATRQWWDDPDLVVWDAKRQAARCWEILHVEFPRLRAELCGAAA